MIFAWMPVSDSGSTRCEGTLARPLRVSSLYQCTRKRFSGCGASGSMVASFAWIAAGIFVGSASSANVGSTMFALRKRASVRA